MQGRRIPDNTFLSSLGTPGSKPGDYGRDLVSKNRDGVEVEEWDWFVRCPNGALQALWVNEDDSTGNRHIVTEHEDGTITVEGSILGRHVSNCSGIGEYHGHLRCGVWD